MGTIIEALMGEENVLDKQSAYKTLALVDKKINVDSKTASIGKKEERISKEELEYAWRSDSFIFNAVNIAVAMIMSANHPAPPYKITAKTAKIRKHFENFVEEISKVGADNTWLEILERIYQDAYIYGGSWDEMVWNVEDTKPVDLKILDAKGMDFARNDNGNIVLDGNEKPVGYVQTVPYGIEVEGMGDEPPSGVITGSNKIFIEAKRIAYIPFYTYGAGFEGIGRVEPAYKATIWKLNLLKAGAESANRRGFSPVIAKVGNENIHPTPQMTASVLESLKTLDYSKYMSIPWYVELTTLDVKSIETYSDFLKYLTAMQSASLGVPVPFVTGLGEETNRATLGTQVKVFELYLNSVASKICRRIEKYMFKPIAEAEGFDEVPKLEWGEITVEKFVKSMKAGEKQDKEEEEVDKEDKEEELDLTTSGDTGGGNSMGTSYPMQGISYPPDMKKKKKSSKKKKV